MPRQPKVNLYQRGKVWWCWFYDHEGKRIRRSTHQKDRSLARKAARRIERERIEKPPGQEAAPVDEVLARFLASRERAGKAEATLDYYIKKARPLTRYFGQADANALKLATIEDYVEDRLENTEPEVSIATVAKEVKTLLSALRHAKRHGLYTGEPSSLLPEDLGGAYIPRDRALSQAEYSALQLAMAPMRSDAAQDRRDYLTGYCNLGVRESELYRIRPDDLDLDTGMVHVRGKKTGRSDRWIPLQEDIAMVLARRAAHTPPGEAIFPPWGNARRDLRAACERADIAPVSHNDLRRTFASWLAEQGVPELVTASLMGHSSSAMVRRVYARIGPDAQRRAIAALPSFAADPTVTLSVTNSVPKPGRGGRSGKTKGPGVLITSGPSVPRLGVEPRTRGFSVPCSTG